MQRQDSPDTETTALTTIAQGAGIIFWGMVVAQLLSYIYNLVIARLGADQYGLFALGLTVFSIVSNVAMLGLTAGTVRYISFYRGQGNEAATRGAILSSLRISSVASVLLAAALFIFAPQIAVILFHEMALSPVLQLFAIAIPFFVARLIFLKSIVAFQEIKYRVYVYNIAENVIKLAVTAILLALGYHLFGAILGYVLAMVCSLGLSLYFLQFRVFPVFGTKSKSVPLDKVLLSYSLPLLLASFATMVMEYTDTFMLGYFRSPAEVGLYSAALATASLLFVGSEVLMPLFLPVTTGLYAQGKARELNSVYRTTTKWLMLILVPSSLALVVFAEPILGVLFGKEYGAAGMALSILIAGKLFLALSFTSQTMLTAIEKTRLVFAITAAVSVANIALNLWLIPIFGILGAAAATGVASMLACFIYAVSAFHYFRAHFAAWDMLKVVAAGALPAAVVYAVARLCGESLVAVVGLCLVLGVAYLALLYLLRAFGKEDKAVLAEVWRRYGGHLRALRP